MLEHEVLDGLDLVERRHDGARFRRRQNLEGAPEFGAEHVLGVAVPMQTNRLQQLKGGGEELESKCRKMNQGNSEPMSKSMPKAL